MVFSPSPGMEVHASVSIGVSRYIPDEQPSTFLKRVDEAMYKAKTLGKNRVFLAPDLPQITGICLTGDIYAPRQPEHLSK